MLQVQLKAPLNTSGCGDSFICPGSPRTSVLKVRMLIPSENPLSIGIALSPGCSGEMLGSFPLSPHPGARALLLPWEPSVLICGR